MRIRWMGKEAVYVPRLERQMREGIEFEASDVDAASFIAEGLAEEVVTAKAETPEHHVEDQRRPARAIHVVVTDTLESRNI